MKKICIIIMFTLLMLPAFAIDESNLQNVGINKYAVLETVKNFTPIRSYPSEDAPRLTHLNKDVVLYADKKNSDWFRVEFEENNYGWVNKKSVEVQAIINNKHKARIEKITFEYDKKYTYIKTKTDLPVSYMSKENNGFQTTLFDSTGDIRSIDYKNKPGSIKLSNNENGNLDIKYINNDRNWGYDTYWEKGEFVIKVRNVPKISKRRPLKGMTVVVDPGHGGNEFGAVNNKNGIKEKDINLVMSKRLKKELQRRGAKVYLTRKKDKYVDLYDRVKFAKEKEGDFLISMHENSLPSNVDPTTRGGTGVYYYNKSAEPLARYIQKQMVDDLKTKDDGVNYGNFVLTRENMPISVLVETAYIIKDDECAMLLKPAFQKKTAKAIRKGLENYLLLK